MFFENTLSERYGRLYASNRLIYIFKDDGIEIGQFESIKDRVYYHIKEYAIDYFKFMFLDMLSREAGKTLVEYKHKLDKIKLKTINEQISNFAQTYPTNLKASSNEALLFMRRYRFANCSCFSCCFKDAYPSSNVQ